MQRQAANILCFKCRVIRDFTILFFYPSILRKLRLTCRTQDADARGWLGRRRGQDAGRTRALCGPDAGRVDARRGPDAGQTRADAVPSYFLAVLYHRQCFHFSKSTVFNTHMHQGFLLSNYKANLITRPKSR